MQQEGEIVLQGRLRSVPRHSACRPADSSPSKDKVPKYSRRDECREMNCSPGPLLFAASRPTALRGWAER